MTRAELIALAKVIYPHSKQMRLQWAKQTYRLNETGKHALLTGGWRNGFIKKYNFWRSWGFSRCSAIRLTLRTKRDSK